METKPNLDSRGGAAATPFGPAPAHFADVIDAWAALQPSAPAYTYWAEGKEHTLSYAQLQLRALGLAARLQDLGWQGQPVLLPAGPGLEFVEAFFGCLYAGAIAVPVPAGRSKSVTARREAIIRDCRPRGWLSSSADAELPAASGGSGADLPVLLADSASPYVGRPSASPRCSELLAFLQYTSGSTAQPKGTAIRHRNILANQQMLRQCFATDHSTVVVSWLPLFHDMGLIGLVLHAAYLGARAILLPTFSVLKRPLLWLEALDRFGGTFTAAPNFAYDLCVDRTTAEQRGKLDLSRWRTAVNGSEPVRRGTLQRFSAAFSVAGFRATAFSPAYGLAEATLVVSGNPSSATRFLEVDASRLQRDEVVPATAAGRGRWLVGCGSFERGDQSLQIVDPESLCCCPAGQVGEIWLAGSHVASGYYQAAAGAETFDARLPGEERRYLRTGDLGFVRDGELFITGRIKDLILVRGQKFHAHDIELSVEEASPLLRHGAVIAFGVEREDQQELVVVAEVESRQAAGAELLALIVRQIREHHDLPLQRVLLVARNTIPKTTSGKLQRRRCRQQFLDDECAVLAQWRNPTTEPAHELAQQVAAEARRWIGLRQKVDPASLDGVLPFAELGLDSIARLDLLHFTETQFGLRLPEEMVHRLDSIDALARFVSGAPAGANVTGCAPSAPAAATSGSRLVLPAFAPLQWKRET